LYKEIKYIVASSLAIFIKIKKGGYQLEKTEWLLYGLIHAFLNTDSSFSTFKEAGYPDFQVILLAVAVSSFGVILLYLGNGKGLFPFVSKILLPFLSRIFRKELDKSFEKFRTATSGIVKKFGYIGLIFLVSIPFAPSLKEAGLVSGQAFGLKYTLLVVLFFNALRITFWFCYMFDFL